MPKPELDNRIEPTACRCILCGSGTHLSMYAHRVAGYIVGWVFACPDCGADVEERSIVLLNKSEHNIKN